MRDQIEPYVKRWVLRFGVHGDHANYPDHRTELTDRRCFEIAQANTYLSTAETQAALFAGKRVYSTLSYYVLEA